MKIVSADPTSKMYQVIGSNNQMRPVSPDEIDKVAANRFNDYQQAGPNPENPEELTIKQKDVNVQQN